MLTVTNLSYSHPDRSPLFTHLNLSISEHEKVALIGNNGSGKSTFLRLIAGLLPPTTGQIRAQSLPYFVPQIFGQYNHLTVAQALQVDRKLTALHQILNEAGTEEAFLTLDDDWTVEERCKTALAAWELSDVALDRKMETLSGGQKTKVFLAGIAVHDAKLVLLDEPSNHLDAAGRELLYHYIRTTKATLLVVSHDRHLLGLLNRMCELEAQGIQEYGGDFDFYSAQKQEAREALSQDIHDKEKALRQAKEKQRESLERQQKRNSRGKGKQEKAGVARIMMNTLRNNAENSTAKMKGVYTDKIDGISQELQQLRNTLPDVDKMRLGFEDSALHKGKILFDAVDINVDYGTGNSWPHDLTLQIRSGDRIALQGGNGSGKTTLLRILMNTLAPTTGQVHKIPENPIYIDQEYSLIDADRTVYEQAQRYNTAALEEHEVKIRLSRFLFMKDSWEKRCASLSGGERLRLTLCCLTLTDQQSDVLILDEPTNNLDLQNVEILTRVIAHYQGTLIVVSHDALFLKEIGLTRTVAL